MRSNGIGYSIRRTALIHHFRDDHTFAFHAESLRPWNENVADTLLVDSVQCKGQCFIVPEVASFLNYQFVDFRGIEGDLIGAGRIKSSTA